MKIDMENPARAGRGVRKNSLCLAACDGSDITPTTSKTQEFRAAFIARRCGLSRDFASIIAPLAFGLEGRP